ncbi:MAG TPA: hypothetical protein VGQ83_01110 [Polyangia bacterium]|jgi:hypothetical protein
MKNRVLGTFALLAALAAPQRAAADPWPTAVVRAEALFREGKRLMQAGRFAEACPKLAESLRLDPGAGGTLLNLAACDEGAGRLTLAWREFTEARTVAQRDGRSDRAQAAHARLVALEKRVGLLTLVVPDGARAPGLAVTRDGAALAETAWGAADAVSPGAHVVTAAAPGRKLWRTTISAAAGQRLRVEVPPLEPEPAAAGDASVPPRAEPPRPDDGTPTVRARPEREDAFGAVLRADVRGTGGGVVLAPGLTYLLSQRVELTLAALLGSKQGAYAGATLFVLRGAWAPRLVVGLPLFFKDGTWPGVQAAAGLEWRMTPRLAAFVDAGVAYFPGAPAGFTKTVFVPAVGLSGRLR